MAVVVTARDENGFDLVTVLKALADLKELQDEDGDHEMQHIEADKILVNLLKDIGLKAVAVEFEKVPKWYA